jgi:cupin 2 domain-containing protein
MDAGNLLAGIARELPEELVTTIHGAKGLRIERIVSQGHCSPEAFWYDQDEHEWVIVLEGEAAVQFQDDSEPVRLRRGSHLYIAAHRKHRVVWTSTTERTVWLAVHYSN